MKTHELKCIQPFFAELIRGEKTFEIRYDERFFQVKEILILKE